MTPEEEERLAIIVELRLTYPHWAQATRALDGMPLNTLRQLSVYWAFCARDYPNTEYVPR